MSKNELMKLLQNSEIEIPNTIVDTLLGLINGGSYGIPRKLTVNTTGNKFEFNTDPKIIIDSNK